jgi:hypothetical protein
LTECEPTRWAVQGKTDEVEPWYGTEFSQHAIPPEWLARWEAAAGGQTDSGALAPPGVDGAAPADAAAQRLSSLAVHLGDSTSWKAAGPTAATDGVPLHLPEPNPFVPTDFAMLEVGRVCGVS